MTQSKRRTPTKRAGAKRWSREVTEHSHALDLEDKAFSKDSPQAIATSLKRSSEHSRRRKASVYGSAMSMLTFYINRAGHHLSVSRQHVLDAAKRELRRLFGRSEPAPKKRTRTAKSKTRAASKARPRTRRKARPR